MENEKLAYWLIVIVAGGFILYGLFGDFGGPVQEIDVLILGCFLGIVARIIQAEVHHIEDKK